MEQKFGTHMAKESNKVKHTICPDGTEVWYLNGEYHREDGPAVIYPNGAEIWCLYGRYHREVGPTIICPDGTEEWYTYGKRIK